MNKERIAIVQMLVCASFWSIAGIFIKLIPWNGFAIAGMRSLISGITIFICMKLMGIDYVLNKKTFMTGLFTACVYICFVCANKLTTAANAIVIQYTCPVFIVIFEVLFYGKKARKQDVTVVLLTLGGIALFFFDQLEGGYILGNIVAIVAGMFMAGMFVTMGELEENQRFSGILNAQILTFLVGLPFFVFGGTQITGTSVLCILILGVIQLGLPYVLYIKATKYCPPLACSLLSTIEPLLNPVWVFIFDGERPGMYALIGGVVVIVSITVWCIFGQEKAPQEKLLEV
ncbi:MAG: EamA family transporter [Oscillospiraceae bacterium]|nr:EamA family transporter [Oscillospiraceae bacterium]